MNTESNIWDGAYKIPWDDPDFSRRMLKEHLSQEHDLASRRNKWIDKQVLWIHENILKAEPARILDLGCGPGFYSHRMAEMGHSCRGIDIGPASIKYAKEHNPSQSSSEFILGDIRQLEFGAPYDLAMLLYGELNVFSPSEVATILQKANTSLCPQGQIIIELQSPEIIKSTGLGATTEQELESGLFSGHPHLYRTENQWLPEENVAIQTFTIIDKINRATLVYHNTTKAWPDDALMGLFAEAGFCTPKVSTTWPSNTPELSLWRGKKEDI